MKSIVVRRNHQLDAATARRMAESIASRMKREFGGSYGWDGDTLRFSRTGASGRVDLGTHELTVQVDLGFVLRPLRARVEREIHAYLDEHLGTATPQAGPSTAPRTTSSRSSRSPKSASNR